MPKAKVLEPSQVKILIETYKSNKDIKATAKVVGLSKDVCITRLKNEGIITIDEANALRGRTTKKQVVTTKSNKNTKAQTTKKKQTASAKSCQVDKKVNKSTKTNKGVKTNTKKSPTTTKKSTTNTKKSTTTTKKKSVTPKTKTNTKKSPTAKTNTKKSPTDTKKKSVTPKTKTQTQSIDERYADKEAYLNEKYGVGKWRILTKEEFVEIWMGYLIEHDMI